MFYLNIYYVKFNQYAELIKVSNKGKGYLDYAILYSYANLWQDLSMHSSS